MRATYERQMAQTVPIAGVTPAVLSQKTPLARIHGKIMVNCEHCDLPFERYACHVVRRAHSYCGVACRIAAMRRPIECVCVICGSKFTQAKAKAQRVVCCSKACTFERRRREGIKRCASHETDALHNYGNPLSGEQSPCAKLTDVQVVEIFNDPRTQRAIAKDYGVAQTLVSKIKNRQTRRQVFEVTA